MNKILYCNHAGHDINYSSDPTPNTKLHQDDLIILNPDDPVSRSIMKVVRINKHSLWLKAKWKDNNGMLFDCPLEPRKVDGDAFYLITSIQPTKPYE